MAGAAAERRYPRLRDVELGTVGAAIAAVTGTSFFVYLLGGAVMWLRFEQADIPSGQAVAVVPRDTLFVVALEALILPCLLIGILVAGVLALVPRLPRAKEPPKKWRDSSPLERSALVLVVLVAVAAAVLILLPFTNESAYTLCVVAVIGAWLVYVTRGGKPVPVIGLGVLLVVTSGLMVLALQLEPPTRLDAVRVTTVKGPDVVGRFVASTAQGVYVGQRDRVVFVPMSQIRQSRLAPPPMRPERRSLLEDLLGLN